jgi:hypothetical protein
MPTEKRIGTGWIAEPAPDRQGAGGQVANVFFFCHGWNGDVNPAKIPQTQAERSVCNFVCRA